MRHFGHAKISNFPQTPKNRTILLNGPLAYPTIRSDALHIIRAKGSEQDFQAAPTSSLGSIRFLHESFDRMDALAVSYPGLYDELEPYFDIEGLIDQTNLVNKLEGELSVYLRLLD